MFRCRISPATQNHGKRFAQKPGEGQLKTRCNSAEISERELIPIVFSSQQGRLGYSTLTGELRGAQVASSPRHQELTSYLLSVHAAILAQRQRQSALVHGIDCSGDRALVVGGGPLAHI